MNLCDPGICSLPRLARLCSWCSIEYLPESRIEFAEEKLAKIYWQLWRSRWGSGLSHQNTTTSSSFIIIWWILHKARGFPLDLRFSVGAWLHLHFRCFHWLVWWSLRGLRGLTRRVLGSLGDGFDDDLDRRVINSLEADIRPATALQEGSAMVICDKSNHQPSMWFIICSMILYVLIGLNRMYDDPWSVAVCPPPWGRRDQ